MSQTQNNQTPNMNGNSSFPSHAAPTSNPFDTDLRGEFTSNFGTNTNAAVSQIFKEGGFGGESKVRYFLLAGLFLVVLGIGGYYAYQQFAGTKSYPIPRQPVTERPAPRSFEPPVIATQDPIAQPEAVVNDPLAIPTEGNPLASDPLAQPSTQPPVVVPPVAQQPVVPPVVVQQPVYQQLPIPADPSTLSPGQIDGPPNGHTMGYNEATPVYFTWGGGSRIKFSRSASMSPLDRTATGGSFAFHGPMPGTWYWQAGSGEVRSFNVNAPIRKPIAIASPVAGQAIPGNGGSVTIQGASGVAYYRVELSSSQNWGVPDYRIHSRSTQVAINGVQPGTYQMRIGAFSEEAGRMEYTSPMPVTIQ